MNILRPFLIQENRKVLYLVNRRILKDQIEKEIKRIQIKTGDIINPIKVETYQSIEKRYVIVNTERMRMVHIRGLQKTKHTTDLIMWCAMNAIISLLIQITMQIRDYHFGLFRRSSKKKFGYLSPQQSEM